MFEIYDNGSILLGKKQFLERYIQKHYIDRHYSDYVDEMEEILDEIKHYDYDTILAIHYDYGMGFYIDEWKKSDAIKEVY